MKKFVKWAVVVAVVGAIFVPSASAASPTMAQFRALKASVATLKTKVTNLRADVNWYENCLGYYNVDQYDGYDFLSYTYTTALDLSSDPSTAARFVAVDSACYSSSASYRSSGTPATHSLVELGWTSELTKHP